MLVRRPPVPALGDGLGTTDPSEPPVVAPIWDMPRSDGRPTMSARVTMARGRYGYMSSQDLRRDAGPSGPDRHGVYGCHRRRRHRRSGRSGRQPGPPRATPALAPVTAVRVVGARRGCGTRAGRVGTGGVVGAPQLSGVRRNGRHVRSRGAGDGLPRLLRRRAERAAPWSPLAGHRVRLIPTPTTPDRHLLHGGSGAATRSQFTAG